MRTWMIVVWRQMGHPPSQRDDLAIALEVGFAPGEARLRLAVPAEAALPATMRISMWVAEITGSWR